MEKHLSPWIGTLPLSQITAPLLLQTLRRIDARGANETAHTLRQTSGRSSAMALPRAAAIAIPRPTCMAHLRTSPDHRQAHGRRPRARWCQCLDARDCRVQRTTRYPGAAGEAARRWRPGPRCAHRRRTHIAAHWTAPASARRQAAPVSGQNCRCPPPAAPRSTRRPKNEQQPACHDGGSF